MNRDISQAAWKALSLRLGVDEPTLRAVAAVESAGSGFLKAPDERPKVLFEGHAFHRLTQGKFAAEHPTLSYPKWTTAHYAGTLAGEWDRLGLARTLDRDAANQSASWGAFQIMGFNYGLCGFTSVEAFVAAQRAGADEQLDAFAQFIARDAFLVPLRQRDWAQFAAQYNGPAYAKNSYDTRLAAAYATFAAAGAAGARRAKVAVAKGKAAKRPLGRPAFSVPPTGKRKAAVRRPVKPDAVDLRDWLYRPTIAKAPPIELWPRNPRRVTHQGNTNACTGFSLATVIEYLLDRAERQGESISGFMLYSMARRYDEWTGNDERDEGSSLRGGLKGWSRHGASAAHLWTKLKPQDPTNEADDWWLDSVKRPMGAYYRIALDSLADMHTALMESGAIYASALTHGGWDELTSTRKSKTPTAPDQIPVIECRRGDPDGGHAFAIVGYTAKGFIVHNSWGEAWGRGGFGILTYSDWRQNAMDAWVVQLGVQTQEHEAVARASSLRLANRQTGQVVLSSNDRLAAHEISPFVIDMQNNGRLSDRGQFRTLPSDLEFLLDHHLLKVACEAGFDNGGVVDVAIYAHGGLVGEASAAGSARQWIPLLYSNQIFPVFLMWETDLLSTVFNAAEDFARPPEQRAGAEWADRIRSRIEDWRDERIEGAAREPGRFLWQQIKDNADHLSRAHSGVGELFRMFKARKARLPRIRLHLIGHSAGAVVHSHLAPRAIEAGFEIGSVSLIAPAVSTEAFAKGLGPAVAKSKIPTLIAHLTEDAEQGDPSCSPYGRSLLYLVSRAFEKLADTPILGMEKHLVPALVSHDWGEHITRLAAPGASYRAGDRLTVATTHGGLDDDFAVQEAIVRHIKAASRGGAAKKTALDYRVVRPTHIAPRRSNDGEAVDEGRSVEERVVTRIAGG